MKLIEIKEHLMKTMKYYIKYMIIQYLFCYNFHYNTLYQHELYFHIVHQMLETMLQTSDVLNILISSYLFWLFKSPFMNSKFSSIFGKMHVN